jgi:predicted Zn-dependent protease
MDAKFGHELRGNLHRQQGRLAEAADAYRSCLERSAGNMSGTSGMLHVSLAEVLLESKNPPTQEILRLLDASMQLNRGSWLNANLFRWERALALVSARIGDRDTSRKAAARALALIEQPPQFARHKDVGIAHATEEERLVLRSLAETGELTTTTRRGRFGRRAR